MNKLNYTGCFGDEYEVRLVTDNYIYGGGLYVGLECYDEEGGWWERFGDITVNIVEFLPENPYECAVDTNNMTTVEDFLRENHIAKPTGKYARSGYCRYPVYQFDPDVIKQLTNLKEGVAVS